MASQQRTLNAGGSDEGFLDDRTLGSRDEYVLDCIPDQELPEHGDLGDFGDSVPWKLALMRHS